MQLGEWPRPECKTIVSHCCRPSDCEVVLTTTVGDFPQPQSGRVDQTPKEGQRRPTLLPGRRDGVAREEALSL